jgi:hypothetical protein
MSSDTIGEAEARRQGSRAGVQEHLASGTDPTIDPRGSHDTVRAALRAAARARCCGDAACHYEDSGLPCAMVEQTARDAAIIAAFLRALPSRFPMPRPGGQTWGHAHGEMARLAALVEAEAHGTR